MLLNSLTSFTDIFREEVTKKIDTEKTQASLICSLESQLSFLSGCQNKVQRLNEERDRAVEKLRGMQESVKY